MSVDQHDVAVVGGSLAGCATAILLARQGARVAILERSPDPQTFKRVCTHFIQPSARNVIDRLGLDSVIDEAGGVPAKLDLWTRYGWIRPPAGSVPDGYNIRRERLDPLLRERAMATPGVDYLAGRRVTELVHAGRRVAGVRTLKAGRDAGEVRARLVVAADGRTSDTARMARVPTLRLPNRRFAYYAYFEDLPLRSGGVSQLWFLDPDVAYAFATDEGQTLIAYWPHTRDLDEVRADPDAAIRRRFGELPGAPCLDDGRQVSGWIGKLDMPNILRPAAYRGLALVGDAAAGNDPLWGVGCGWALQSAGWLADAAGPALAGSGDTAAGLRAYARRHLREIGLAHLLMTEHSTGRRFLPPEKLMFAAAARDGRTATTVHRFAARVDPPHRLLSPPAIGRAAWALAPSRRPRLASVADASRGQH